MSSKEERAYAKRKREQWTCALLYLLMWAFIVLSFYIGREDRIGGDSWSFSEPRLIGSNLRIEYRGAKEDRGKYVLFQKQPDSRPPQIYSEEPDKERMEKALDCRVLRLNDLEAIDRAVDARYGKYSVDIDLDVVENLENTNADDKFYFAVYVESKETEKDSSWDRIMFEDVTPLVTKYLQRRKR